MNYKRTKKERSRRSNKGKLIVILFILLIIVCLTKSFSKEEQETVSQENRQDENEIAGTERIEEKITEKSSFPTDVFGVPVYTELIEINTKARPGTKRRIRYIVIHETDNFEKTTGAKNHAQFLSENNMASTSWHYTVDDKEIYHHIPDNEVAYHAANEIGNLYGIGVELCVNHGGDFEKTFDNATKLVAYLLKEYDLTIYDLKTHHDFSGKDCPNSILKNNRMDEFIEKVEEYM